MNKSHWSNKLVNLGACEEAVKFARQFKTFQTAWNNCENPQWMFWWLQHRPSKITPAQHKKFVKIACECARLVLHLVPTNEKRPKLAIKAAEHWIKNPMKHNSWMTGAAEAAAGAAAGAARAATVAAAGAARAAAEAAEVKIIRKHFPKP
jgi:hypothetical protein